MNNKELLAKWETGIDNLIKKYKRVRDIVLDNCEDVKYNKSIGYRELLIETVGFGEKRTCSICIEIDGNCNLCIWHYDKLIEYFNKTGSYKVFPNNFIDTPNCAKNIDYWKLIDFRVDGITRNDGNDRKFLELINRRIEMYEKIKILFIEE